jgi:lipopolysaccharide/colanic/teichoic acid biosynthesis glycosyltransferase
MSPCEDKATAAVSPFLVCARIVSRVLAVIVLAIYLPSLILCGLLVLMTSPGPAFVKRAYRRSRGEREVVYLYEFRTECWRTWRETPLGFFLRQTDMHRLPRLANVLLGEVTAGERLQSVTA